MKFNNQKPKDFKLRKTLHYFLILCVLLIQVIIGIFFFTEYKYNTHHKFLNSQLKEIKPIEDLTKSSQNNISTAQNNLQQYLMTNDIKYLDQYYQSVNELTNNFKLINQSKLNNLDLSKNLVSMKQNIEKLDDLKSTIDTTYQYSTNKKYKQNDIPEFKNFKYDYNLKNLDIEVKTFSDSIAKKGLFGRMKDAISGKVDVRKDSTVVIMNNAKTKREPIIKAEFDKIISEANNFYKIEAKKFAVKKNKTNDKNIMLFNSFNNLLLYSNDIINTYKNILDKSKLKIEHELKLHDAKKEKIRYFLVVGLLILMFIVSILIMYFTRLAFIYEWKLNDANQQIKEHLNFKNRILGMLSHELRSPLKIIGIFINRIDKKTDDADIKNYLKSITFTNNTLLMQANQILEYTKNQQVENKLNPVKFNLKSEITSIINAIEPYINTRNNKLVFKENIPQDLVVFTDNTKINQVYMNILGNANKFTENGTITVNTSTNKLNDKTFTLTTIISDTGAGISETDLKHILEPYYQGILPNEVENIGAGLGLNLCKEIIELYNGSINIESEINKGTTVTFTINLNINP